MKGLSNNPVISFLFLRAASVPSPVLRVLQVPSHFTHGTPLEDGALGGPILMV